MPPLPPKEKWVSQDDIRLKLNTVAQRIARHSASESSASEPNSAQNTPEKPGQKRKGVVTKKVKSSKVKRILACGNRESASSVPSPTKRKTGGVDLEIDLHESTLNLSPEFTTPLNSGDEGNLSHTESLAKQTDDLIKDIGELSNDPFPPEVTTRGRLSSSNVLSTKIDHQVADPVQGTSTQAKSALSVPSTKVSSVPTVDKTKTQVLRPSQFNPSSSSRSSKDSCAQPRGDTSTALNAPVLSTQRPRSASSSTLEREGQLSLRGQRAQIRDQRYINPVVSTAGTKEKTQSTQSVSKPQSTQSTAGSVAQSVVTAGHAATTVALVSSRPTVLDTQPAAVNIALPHAQTEQGLELEGTVEPTNITNPSQEPPPSTNTMADDKIADALEIVQTAQMWAEDEFTQQRDIDRVKSSKIAELKLTKATEHFNGVIKAIAALTRYKATQEQKEEAQQIRKILKTTKDILEDLYNDLLEREKTTAGKKETGDGGFDRSTSKSGESSPVPPDGFTSSPNPHTTGSARPTHIDTSMPPPGTGVPPTGPSTAPPTGLGAPTAAATDHTATGLTMEQICFIKKVNQSGVDYNDIKDELAEICAMDINKDYDYGVQINRFTAIRPLFDSFNKEIKKLSDEGCKLNDNRVYSLYHNQEALDQSYRLTKKIVQASAEARQIPWHRPQAGFGAKDVTLPSFNPTAKGSMDYYTFRTEFEKYVERHGQGIDHVLELMRTACKGTAKQIAFADDDIDRIWEQLKRNWGDSNQLFHDRVEELAKSGPCPTNALAKRDWVLEVNRKYSELIKLCDEHDLVGELHHCDAVDTTCQQLLKHASQDFHKELVKAANRTGTISREEKFNGFMDFMKRYAGATSAELTLANMSLRSRPQAQPAKQNVVQPTGRKFHQAVSPTMTASRSRSRSSSPLPIMTAPQSAPTAHAAVTVAPASKQQQKPAPKTVKAKGSPPREVQCNDCGANHTHLLYCKEYQKRSTEDRAKMCSARKVCFRCLRMDSEVDFKNRAKWAADHNPQCMTKFACVETYCGQKPFDRQKHITLCKAHAKDNQKRDDDLVKSLDKLKINSNLHFLFNAVFSTPITTAMAS